MALCRSAALGTMMVTKHSDLFISMTIVMIRATKRKIARERTDFGEKISG